MMDSSFQFVTGGSSWLVSVVKIQFKFIDMIDVFMNVEYISLTFFTVLTAKHGGRTVAVCL